MKWVNFTELKSYQKLADAAKTDIRSELGGAGGAARVQSYQAPMASGMVYSYAAKAVNDELLDLLQEREAALKN